MLHAARGLGLILCPSAGIVFVSLIIQCFLVVLWFIPMVWDYRRSLEVPAVPKGHTFAMSLAGGGEEFK